MVSQSQNGVAHSGAITPAAPPAAQPYTAEQAANTALAILAAIMKMSDHAEALGGAKSIAGVAALHTMQTSIQKSGPRLAKLAQAMATRPSADALTGQSEAMQHGNSGMNPK